MEWRNSKPPISGEELRKWREEQNAKTRYIVRRRGNGWIVWDKRNQDAASKTIPDHRKAADMCMSMNRMFGETAHD